MDIKDKTEKAPARAIGALPGMTVIFSAAGAAAVANLYLAQPLLASITTSLGISITQVSSLITATQLGYAAGVLLIMPLGDVVNRHRLIPMRMALSALALLGCAVAPNHLSMLGSVALVGITSLGGQLLLPLTGELAAGSDRGKVIGTIASGMLIGSMLSRLVSGFLADQLGWRFTYSAAAVLNIAMAMILRTRLPQDNPRRPLAYGALLISTARAVLGQPALWRTLAIGSSAFTVFTMYWTGLTYLLSAAPYFYRPTQIGLMSVVGLVGALAAKDAGRFLDRGRADAVMCAGLGLLLLAVLCAAFSARSIYLLIATTALFSFAVQIVFVLSQSTLLTARPELSNRINAAYVCLCFAGGATGSALVGVLWRMGAWPLLAGAMVGLTAVALLAWYASRPAANASADPMPTQQPLPIDSTRQAR